MGEIPATAREKKESVIGREGVNLTTVNCGEDKEGEEQTRGKEGRIRKEIH